MVLPITDRTGPIVQTKTLHIQEREGLRQLGYKAIGSTSSGSYMHRVWALDCQEEAPEYVHEL